MLRNAIAPPGGDFDGSEYERRGEDRETGQNDR